MLKLIQRYRIKLSNFVKLKIIGAICVEEKVKQIGGTGQFSRNEKLQTCYPFGIKKSDK